MLLAFMAQTERPALSALEEASRAELDALRAIGILTRLAGAADTEQDAARLHSYITRVEKSARLASLTALARKDERQKEHR